MMTQEFTLIGENQRYRLEKRLGGGGMGNVFLATDTRLNQAVAIKILKESLTDDETMRIRFNWELAICAALKNPHIVQVSDYGVTSDGHPFYVMEYLQGETLGQRLVKSPRLSPEQTCQIITQVCEALELAHQGIVASGENIKVIHRDLKPENIFLVPTALGELVKVIDFGIAKIRSLQGDQTNVTNMFLGTCHYAAPEQFEAAPDLDERADIYSLGMIMYEMLSGFDPFGFDFRGKRVSGESWLLAHVSKKPKFLRSWPDCEEISPALESVVMTCLQKSPQQRFASVRELREAIEVALTEKTLRVSAALPQKPLKILPWLVLSLISGAIAIGVSPLLITPPPPTTVSSAASWTVFQSLTGHQDLIWTVSLTPDGQTLISGSEDKTLKLWDAQTGKLLKTLSGHGQGVRSTAVSPDGSTLVSASADGIIKVWDLGTGQLLYTIPGHHDSIWSVVISPDGTQLASGSTDGTIRLWNLETGKILQTIAAHDDWVFAVAFGPDGTQLASAGKDGTIKLWDSVTGKELFSLVGHQDAVRAIAFHPYLPQLASASWDGTVKVWDLATHKVVSTLAGHRDRVVAVIYSQDGQTLISSSIDSTIKIWNLASQSLEQTLSGHHDWVLALTNAANLLVSSSKDNTIKLWRL